ncbi:MAG TPA: HPr family phosphocarrier protein [Firmicutes bacterium]|nr:HPr family phosphocarrier protein [Bacillota bacterium]
MYKAKVHFDTVVDVKKFVNICNSVSFDVDLLSGRYVVDGKSIMGLFSLDLSKPVELQADCGPDDEFVTKIASYLVP